MQTCHTASKITFFTVYRLDFKPSGFAIINQKKEELPSKHANIVSILSMSFQMFN